MQFHVGKLDDAMFALPHGYQRAALIDRGICSVHMGVCRLAAGGSVDACVHAKSTDA